jgi:hypothetical protein
MNRKYRSNYLSYVLRLWRDDEDVPWRASLECARTGERQSFADLSALFAFLDGKTTFQLAPLAEDERSLPHDQMDPSPQSGEPM